MQFIPLAAALALIGVHAIAAAMPDYRCKVERIYAAAGEGNDSFVHQERKTYVGKEFSVDRRTGAMSGILKNNYATSPQIVDPGSRDNSFKSVATLPPGKQGNAGSVVFTLVINEYLESPTKPFVFLSNDVVYFGSCRHDR